MILFLEILNAAKKESRIAEFMVMNHPAMGNPANQGFTTSDPTRTTHARSGVSVGADTTLYRGLAEDAEEEESEEENPPFKKRTWETNHLAL